MADYGGFGAIVKQAQAYADEERRREADPVACPRCGLLLDVNSNGTKNCRMGHYRQGG